MKDNLSLKSSHTFSKKNNIKVSNYRTMIAFMRNLDSSYLKDMGETECLSFLFDVVESSKQNYGNVILNELKYMFDCNDELLGSRILFNMMLNRDLSKMVKKANFKRINKMCTKVSISYIDDKTSYIDFNSKFFDELIKNIKKNLRGYMYEYLEGEGGYYASYSLSGLKKIYMNVAREFILFNSGVYNQIYKYEIDRDEFDRYKSKYDELFSKKLGEAVYSFEATVDDEAYSSKWGHDADEYERRSMETEVETASITRAYDCLCSGISAFRIKGDLAIQDITSETGMNRIIKSIDSELEELMKTFSNVLYIELNSYVEETDITLDVLISDYMENIISNLIFTLVLDNIMMFINMTPMNNRTGKNILQRLTRSVGFLNLLNDSLDVSFDMETEKYIRMDWCK